MIARKLKPGPPLGEFVECLWYYDGYSVPHARERALPTGTLEIVFNLRDDRIRLFREDSDLEGTHFRGSVVCGAHAGYFVIGTAEQSTVLGVHFKPGGAAPFLGLPAAEVSDAHVGLDDIWGSAAHTLRERLLDTPNPDARLALLERALIARLHPAFSPNPAVAYALHQLTSNPALARVNDVRTQSGYSPKRFIQLFRGAVGLTPKVYCRVQRFQSVIRRLSQGKAVEWANVALDGGYYDQSHLNREFRSFTGLTPSEYQPILDRPNHVPIES